jgi:hypothetical protein
MVYKSYTHIVPVWGGWGLLWKFDHKPAENGSKSGH